MDEVVSAFEAEYPGRVLSARKLGSGHIHDTFVLSWTVAQSNPAAPGQPPAVQGRAAAAPAGPARAHGGARELLVQRFNTDVFTDPAGVMHNIARVSAHLRQKLAAEEQPDAARRVLQIVPTPSGRTFWTSAAGLTFRAFDFISDARSFELAPSERHAFEAGRAFGEFAARLCDLPAPPLAETIPGFHDTEARLRVLRAAFEADLLGRGVLLRDERARVEARASLAGLCTHSASAGTLPQRVIHNDAKLSNLLFDARGERALCVVDLDTVMRGFAAYDFGDLVRTTACHLAEDAESTDALSIRMDYLAALTEGYIGALGAHAGADELASLIQGPRLVCYELGMRFLTDHLLGDRYFAIERPGQNLDRARVQLALVDALEQREPELHAYVARHAKG